MTIIPTTTRPIHLPDSLDTHWQQRNTMTTENTERDELADIMMRGEIIKTAWLRRRPHALADADAILAAGYTKPRQVTTIAELDALPDGAVIQDAVGAIRERFNDAVTGAALWYRTAGKGYVLTCQFSGSLLPATVLYSPVVGA